MNITTDRMDIVNEMPILAMPSRKRSTWIMFLGNQTIVLSNIVRNLVLIPIYLKYISVEVFGAWVAFSGAISFIALADFGLNNFLTQRTARLYGAREYDYLARTISSILLVLTVLSTAALILVWTTAPYVVGLIGVKGAPVGELIFAFRLAALDGMLMLLALGIGGILIGLQRPGFHMSGMIMGQIMGITVTLMALLSDWGILSIPIGMLCGTGLVLTMNVFASWNAVKGIIPAGSMSFDIKTMKELAGSTSLLFIVRICNLISTRSYGIVVAAVLSAPLVVVIELTRKASIMVVDVISRLPMSLFSGLSHMVGTGERKKMQHITEVLFRITFLLSMLGAGGVILLNREFVHLWTGDRFFGGNILNLSLCLYAVVQLMNAVCYNVIFASGCFKTLTLAYACEAALQLVLSITLGYLFGLNGVALGFVIAALSAMVIQGVKVMSLFDYSIFDRHLLSSTMRIAVTGCIPFVLGLLMSRIWVPRGWWGLSIFGFQYAMIGTAVLMTVDATLRRQLLLLIRR